MSFTSLLNNTGSCRRYGDKATLTLASVVAGQTVTINGITFTAHATTTTIAARQFSIAGTNAQDAAELATCINSATYGVSGVSASANLGIITLSVTDTTVTLAISASNTTITVSQADSLGHPLRGWVTLGTYPCRIEMLSSRELLTATQPTIATHRLFAAYGTPCSERDQWVIGSTTYEITQGDSDVAGAGSHVEALLKEVRA